MIEAVSHRHTLYGRKNKLGGPVEMLLWQKDAAVRVEKAHKMTPEDLAGKITIGTLIDRELPVYTQELHRIRGRPGPRRCRERSRLARDSIMPVFILLLMCLWFGSVPVQAQAGPPQRSD